MKIYLNSANEDWIVDRQREWWYAHCPDTIPNTIGELDIVWLIAPWQWRQVPRKLLKQKRVICTIHHVDETKFDNNAENEFRLRDDFVDQYLVPNRITKEFVWKHTSKPVQEIGYFFDPNIWKRDENNYRKEFELKEDDFVVGSFQRDTEGHDLKSPKLCKGPDLFCDYVERLNKKNIVVLLGGWRRQYIINRLVKAGIRFVYKEMPNQETIRRMYQCCNLYVVSSRTEGGPQALLEASSMRTPIISTNCGMALDVLSSHCVYDLSNEYYPTYEDMLYGYNNVQRYDIRKIKEKYLKFFEEVLK